MKPISCYLHPPLRSKTRLKTRIAVISSQFRHLIWQNNEYLYDSIKILSVRSYNGLQCALSHSNTSWNSWFQLSNLESSKSIFSCSNYLSPLDPFPALELCSGSIKKMSVFLVTLSPQELHKIFWVIQINFTDFEKFWKVGSHYSNIKDKSVHIKNKNVTFV